MSERCAQEDIQERCSVQVSQFQKSLQSSFSDQDSFCNEDYGKYLDLDCGRADSGSRQQRDFSCGDGRVDQERLSAFQELLQRLKPVRNQCGGC